MNDQKNLLLAIVLSAIVVIGYQYFIIGPEMEAERARQAELAEQQQAQPQPQQPAAPPPLPRAQVIAQSARVPVDTPNLSGSVNLSGGRIDDLKLRAYRQTLDPASPEIELLSPSQSERPYFAEFGWVAPQGATAQAPGAATLWTLVSGNRLSPGNDLVLSYDDGEGLAYTRRIAVDNQYMFTITDRVENRGTAPAVLYPYALVSRKNLPQLTNNWIVHEGFIGVADGVLQDPSYSDLGEDNETREFESTGGWLGITDKYWMTAVAPPQDGRMNGSFKAFDENGVKGYQADYRLEPRTVAPGGAQEVTHHLFAGAKVNDIIEDYRTRLNIPLFDYAIDWGWFWFLTKPIFLALDYLYRVLGNFGVAILVFTVFVKLLFFPLSNTSYRAMSKMKKLQPEMERLRDAFKDDRMGQQQAMMELYRKEKVNPLAGCLPVVVQIPVFFSLYKVLFVTIEMRHAPFFGWIRDLSAPDPLSIFNLFGLIPFDPSQIPFIGQFLMLGPLPIIMGFTMWFQMKLNPPAADPAQQKIFTLMPILFTFLTVTFPAGLVIYWAWNNVLSIVQQAYIMKRTGTPIDIFERLSRRRKPAEAKKPDR